MAASSPAAFLLSPSVAPQPASPPQLCTHLRAFVPALSTDSFSRYRWFHLSLHPGLCLNLIYLQRPSIATLSKMTSLAPFNTALCIFSFIPLFVCMCIYLSIYIFFSLYLLSASPRMQIPWGQKTGFVPAASPMPRGCPGIEEAHYMEDQIFVGF